MERRKRVILDTHIWIKWVFDQAIPKKFINVLENNNFEKCLSAFSIWELAMLVSKKRLKLECDISSWVSTSLERSNVVLLPLSPKIAILSCNLDGNFHGDPGDRIIAATAISEGATLLTEDKRILKYAKTGHLKAH